MVAGSDYKLVVVMAACMETEGVGFYARQGWEWDSRTYVSPGSQSRGSKRQLEGAEGVGGVRGWVEDAEGKAERQQRLRQQQRRSQVQQEEAALEGAVGGPAGGDAPCRRRCK